MTASFRVAFSSRSDVHELQRDAVDQREPGGRVVLAE
jgi:hypothetical protein